MKKLIFALAVTSVTLLSSFSSVAGAATGDGLLWRVSGNGLERPSYLLGSHHMAPAKFVDSISGFEQALAEVDAVYGEVDKAELTTQAMQQKMMIYAMAPADSTLSRVLTPRQLAGVDSLFAVFTGQPGLTAQMDMLKPTMLSLQLAVLQLNAALPEASTMEPFDVTVLSLAESLGKQLGALETADMQLDFIFGQSIAEQAADLVELVDNNQKLMQQARDVTDSYLRQDLDAVAAIILDPEGCDDEADLERILFSRNRTWTDELAALMPGRPLLAVVGCGHLCGPQGLVELLRGRGYDVEPVH